MNHKKNLQLIVDILNFDNSVINLSNRLKTEDIDWEKFVALASRQLVLTTCYCRLKQKHLLHLLPEDLIAYLQNVTEINRNRNTDLVNQAYSISNLLARHSIKHIYFKGMGLLLSGKFEDNAERMIGDIDILIDSSKIQKAYSILKQNGYKESGGFNYENKNFRHLPRLIDENRLAAVELHDNILKTSKRKLLDIEHIFQNAECYDNICVPSDLHQYKINVLTTQINNLNYYYNSFTIKSYYDNLVLGIMNNKFSIENLNNDKYFISYHQKYRYWNGLGINRRITLTQKIRFFTYKLNLSNNWFERATFMWKFFINWFFKRLNLFILNPSYRKHIMKNKVFNKTSSNLIL